jgi:hypothetical protein
VEVRKCQLGPRATAFLFNNNFKLGTCRVSVGFHCYVWRNKLNSTCDNNKPSPATRTENELLESWRLLAGPLTQIIRPKKKRRYHGNGYSNFLCHTHANLRTLIYCCIITGYGRYLCTRNCVDWNSVPCDVVRHVCGRFLVQRHVTCKTTNRFRDCSVVKHGSTFGCVCSTGRFLQGKSIYQQYKRSSVTVDWHLQLLVSCVFPCTSV